MTITGSLLEIIFTVTAAAAFGIGAFKYFRKPSAMFIRMVVCMLGCRFLQGLLELLLVREGADMRSFSLVMIGGVAQFLFLICANYGAIDSLCDDGSIEFLKYRLIALIAPVALFVYFVIIMGRVGESRAQSVYFLICAVVPLIALYYHIKHLIIKDVEDGFIKNIRLYNFIGIINCACSARAWLSEQGGPLWIISMCLSIFVTIAILPALVSGAKKWMLF